MLISSATVGFPLHIALHLRGGRPSPRAPLNLSLNFSFRSNISLPPQSLPQLLDWQPPPHHFNLSIDSSFESNPTQPFQSLPQLLISEPPPQTSPFNPYLHSAFQSRALTLFNLSPDSSFESPRPSLPSISPSTPHLWAAPHLFNLSIKFSFESLRSRPLQSPPRLPYNPHYRPPPSPLQSLPDSSFESHPQTFQYILWLLRWEPPPDPLICPSTPYSGTQESTRKMVSCQSAQHCEKTKLLFVHWRVDSHQLTLNRQNLAVLSA